MLKQRLLAAKGKNFSLDREGDFDFSKLRIGTRKIDNPLINLGSYKNVNSNYGNKLFILNAIYNHDYETLREISKYFFESSGIYYRLCKYLAGLYRYDWYITPYIIDTEKEKEDKVLKDFSKVLRYFDKSNIKRLCGNVALDIITEGVYYGIINDLGDKFSILKLPVNYCRSRFYSGTEPIVELNLQFFDAYFTNPAYKIEILKTFPKDIQYAYVLYRLNKLKGDYPGDRSCWVPLDPAFSVKLSINDTEFPCLVGVIPMIIDLDEAQELDRLKTMLLLLKIIVLKLPLDKNGDLIFDVTEARDIHNTAVLMLKRCIGVDVLTTFTDVEAINTRDNNSVTSMDDLEKVERSLYNAAGVSRNIFNAEGNQATTNSILADESAFRDIPLLFAGLFNKISDRFSRKNHYSFEFTMLETTLFNYRELSKLFKEQALLGYNILLPQIALGLSQSTIIADITFLNLVLHLSDIMIPPRSSNTMSGKDLGNNNSSNQLKNLTILTDSDKQVGRPQKEDNEKSDKTILNMNSEL